MLNIVVKVCHLIWTRFIDPPPQIITVLTSKTSSSMSGRIQSKQLVIEYGLWGEWTGLEIRDVLKPKTGKIIKK